MTPVPVRSNCLEADNAENGTEQSGCGSQTRTTLYVRHGSLVSFTPEKPAPEIAEALVDNFKNRFQEWQPSYKESISLAAKVNVSALEFRNDYIRVAWERGKSTLVLDCPRLRIAYGGTILETRACLTICVKGTRSSKIWNRVSLPLDMPEISSKVEMDQLRGLCSRFREIANASITWALNKLQEILPSHLPDSRPETRGFIKATILGITDSLLAPKFKLLCEEGITAADVLSDDNVDQKLTEYCQQVSDIDGMLSSYTEQTKLHKAIWFKVPLCVVLHGGETADRMVLFLMRDFEEHSEIIGFAYDDSERGDLALRAGAKLSKIIGPWV